MKTATTCEDLLYIDEFRRAFIDFWYFCDKPNYICEKYLRGLEIDISEVGECFREFYETPFYILSQHEDFERELEYEMNDKPDMTFTQFMRNFSKENEIDVYNTKRN